MAGNLNQQIVNNLSLIEVHIPPTTMDAPLGIHIEYCSSCGYRPRANELQGRLEEAFGPKVDVALAAGRGGSFEVTAGDKLLHSKLQAGKWAKVSAIIEQVGAILGDQSAAETVAAARDVETEDTSFIDATARKHVLVVFSKTTCPHCDRAKKILAAAGAHPHVVELDMRPDTTAIQDALAEITGRTTVPNVFIGGKSVGGADELEQLQAAGTLIGVLKDAGVPLDDAPYSPQPSVVVTNSVALSPSKKTHGDTHMLQMPHPSNGSTLTLVSGSDAVSARKHLEGPFGWPSWLVWPFFFFPYNVDIMTSRATSCTVAILAAVAAGGYDTEWGCWLATLLAADYVLRIVWAGRASLIGSVVSTVTVHFKPVMYPGPPRQFAQMVGFMFAGLATLLRWLEPGDKAYEIAGSTILAMLAGAAAMDGFLNFCLGCLFFRIGSQILGADPSAKCDSIQSEDTANQVWWRKVTADGMPQDMAASLPNEDEPRHIPYVYKTKNDEQEKAGFSIVRHTDSTYLVWPLSMAGLAACWKIAHDSPLLSVPKGAWIATCIAAAAVFAFVVGALCARGLLHPRKAAKDWDDLNKASALGALPLTLCVFALILQSESHAFARALFWVGAILLMLLTLALCTTWVRRPIYRGTIGPMWLLVPVGNLLVAAVAPVVDSDYTEAGYLWLGMGSALWLVLWPMTFQRVMFGAPLQETMRPGLFIWVACPPMLAVAWSALNGFDALALVCTQLGLGLLLFMMGLFATGYLGRNRFDVGYWAYAFPLQVQTMALLLWYQARPTDGSEFFAKAGLAIVSYSTSILLANTIASISGRMGLFVAPAAAGPGMLGKLSHYAFRGALSKMQTLAKRLHSPAALRELATLVAEFGVAHHEHMVYEDTVMFPQLDAFFPGVSRMAGQQHEGNVGDLTALCDLMQTLAPATYNAVTQRVQAGRCVAPTDTDPIPSARDAGRVVELLDVVGREATEHMDWEEAHLGPLLRKYLNAKMHKTLARKMWEGTEPNKWRVILPFLVNNQVLHFRRVQLLKAWIAAMPERAHLVGQMVYEGVDAFLWTRLIAELPELAPRHTRHHHHYA